jgi:Zn finger protein HypA/HybF involved in hydrogenase expression
MRTDILEQKEQILKWIEEEQPKAFICRQLHCKPETLNSYMKKMGIEYAGQPSKKGRNLGQGYLTAEQYLCSGSVIKSHTLKLKLFKDGIKAKQCEICGVSQWQGVELPLELHHKDGDHYNNELSNLMILCPNCHSIQEGNSGKAVKSKEEIAKLAKEAKRTASCVVCGKPITRNSTYCPECYARESRIVERPSREELKNLIRTTSFLQIGKTYNVSDNAVRKWCVGYGLPKKSSDIKSYSDEEWADI